MYEFLSTYLPKRYADILIQIWYILLIIVNAYLMYTLDSEGAFRYIGW